MLAILRARTLAVTAAVATALAGCAPMDKSKAELQPLNTAYDYQLLDHQFQATSLEATARQLREADVVFIGEYHRNQASHLLEMQLFGALHHGNQQTGRPMVLSLEMFTRDQQTILDDYLASKIGEKYLIEEAPAWKNYQSSYRPLVEYAKRQQMPVVAANASGDLIRCIGRKGDDYLSVLSDEEKSHLAEQPFAEIPGYQEKFFGFMSGANHMPSNGQLRSYMAQAARDNTMAESIAKALQENPGSQVVHLNGSFHSEDHLGTVAALKRINPDLKIKVVTPVHLQDFTQAKKEQQRRDDFYYLLNPQPREFVNEDYMKKTHKAMFKKSREKAKACKPI